LQYRLRRFGIHATALIASIIYFVLAVVFSPIFYLASRNAPNGPLPGILFIIGPVCYAIFGYVFVAIGCWLYNLVAGWTGGMVLTLEPGESASV
jgi:hypothetical protein